MCIKGRKQEKCGNEGKKKFLLKLNVVFWSINRCFLPSSLQADPLHHHVMCW